MEWKILEQNKSRKESPTIFFFPIFVIQVFKIFLMKAFLCVLIQICSFDSGNSNLALSQNFLSSFLSYVSFKIISQGEWIWSDKIILSKQNHLYWIVTSYCCIYWLVYISSMIIKMFKASWLLYFQFF